jgi:hypothetical protein
MVRGALAKRDEMNLWEYFIDADDLKRDVRRGGKPWTPTRFFALVDSAGTHGVSASHHDPSEAAFEIEARGHIHGGEYCAVTYVFDRSLKLSVGEKHRLKSLLKAAYRNEPQSRRDAARQVAKTLGIEIVW